MLSVEVLRGSGSPLTANSYILNGKPKIQIDAGARSDANILVLTHCHCDHIVYGEVMKKSGARVYASKETADAVKGMGEETCAFFYGEMKPFEVDVVVEGGGFHKE